MICVRYKTSWHEQSEAKRKDWKDIRDTSQTKMELVDLISTLSEWRARGGGGRWSTGYDFAVCLFFLLHVMKMIREGRE